MSIRAHEKYVPQRSVSYAGINTWFGQRLNWENFWWWNLNYLYLDILCLNQLWLFPEIFLWTSRRSQINILFVSFEHLTFKQCVQISSEEIYFTCKNIKQYQLQVACENMAKLSLWVMLLNLMYNRLCSHEDGLQKLCPSISGSERFLKGDQVFDV